MNLALKKLHLGVTNAGGFTTKNCFLMSENVVFGWFETSSPTKVGFVRFRTSESLEFRGVLFFLSKQTWPVPRCFPWIYLPSHGWLNSYGKCRYSYTIPPMDPLWVWERRYSLRCEWQSWKDSIVARLKDISWFTWAKKKRPYFPLNPGCLRTVSSFHGLWNPHITGGSMSSPTTNKTTREFPPKRW